MRLELCNDLMAVFDAIDPGLSQTRGLTMLEMIRSKLDMGQAVKKEEYEFVVKCLEMEEEDSISRKKLAALEKRL